MTTTTWPLGFSVRLIGKKDCHKCRAFRGYLDQSGLPYDYYDAENPNDEVQKQLDKWMITDMPVLQILKDNAVIHQYLPGLKSTRSIMTMMKTIGAKI